VDLSSVLILAPLPLVWFGRDAGQEPSITELLRGDRAAYARLVARGEAAVPDLARVLSDTQADGVTRFMAANVLGDIGSSLAFEPLLAALQDPFYNVRRCAALALGKIRDEARGLHWRSWQRRIHSSGKIRSRVRRITSFARMLGGRSSSSTDGRRSPPDW